MKKIYYIIPDLHQKQAFLFKKALKSLFKGSFIKYIRDCLFESHKPTGGVKVIYQHCILLRELGYDAKPVLMGSYHGNFFNYDVPFVRYKDIRDCINSEDIVVATEFRPYQGLLFRDAKKVLFLQNWIGLTKWLEPSDRGKSYIELGYDKVITCSQYCSDYVSYHMNIDVVTITNGINLSVFKPNKKIRVVNRILAMSRKNPNDLQEIISHLNGTIYDFRIVDGLNEDELIKEYQAADIFLATGYPEGFSLPPIEAMACGCMVIGFSGGAGKEFMIHDNTALVAEDGDCKSVVNMLLELCKDTHKKEVIRHQGMNKAQQYGLCHTKKQLEHFFRDL